MKYERENVKHIIYIKTSQIRFYLFCAGDLWFLALSLTLAKYFAIKIIQGLTIYNSKATNLVQYFSLQ